MEEIYLSERFQDLSKRRYDHLHESLITYGNEHGEEKPAERASAIMQGDEEPTIFEAVIICRELRISLEELLNPAFSLRDADNRLYDQEEAELAAKYNLSRSAA